MNSFEEPFDEQQVDADSDFRAEIDRMVDGELSDEQQRSLLERLEDSPAGWKTLAIAYVEASVWKSHFSASDTKVAPDAADPFATNPLPCPPESSTVFTASPEAVATHKPNSQAQSSSSSVFAAIAVLLVFGLGIWLGRTQVEWPRQPNSIAGGTGSPESESPNALPQEEPEQVHNDDKNRDVLPVPKTVQVVYSDGKSDVLRVVDVPIADSITGDGSKQLDEFWHRPESAIPAELRAELEQTGHRITESRDLWPAQLPDGRSVVIPVSQVHVANNPLVFP